MKKVTVYAANAGSYSDYRAHLANVKSLLSFLAPSLPTVNSCGVAYDNMAALLADVSLQAGLNYERVVWPRVATIIREYPNCHGMSELVDVLRWTSVRELLQWRGEEKISRFQAILKMLIDQNIESIECLAVWIETREASEQLMSIRGVGNKTVDYLRLLCGKIAFPLDRHFVRFLKLAGVNAVEYGYDYAQRLLVESCDDLGLDPRKAERGLWLLLRACV